MMCCSTWYVFLVVALKVKKASSAQNRELPTSFFFNAPDQQRRFESTPRVSHGTQ